MVIMVAGGLTFAAPGIMPAAHAAATNANLFVSAENAAFDNTFSGPRVIEVVINDPGFASLDDAHGQPDVTVNGKQLLMAQASDGSWYAYFADRTMAKTADQTLQGMVPSASAAIKKIGGQGLDFGTFCTSSTELKGKLPGSLKASDAELIAIPIGTNITAFTTTNNISVGSGGHLVTPLSPTLRGSNGTATEAACVFDTNAYSFDFVSGTDIGTGAGIDPRWNNTLTNNVVREFKSLSNGTTTNYYGNVDMNINAWPLIQLYNFADGGQAVVQYNKGGNVQTVTLNFSIGDDFVALALDNNGALPQSSELHVTVTDPILNIDPTDEDVWTWDTTNSNMFYQLFDEAGNAPGADQTVNVYHNRSSLGFEDDQGDFTINRDLDGDGTNILTFSTNQDQIDTTKAPYGFGGISQMVTLVEQGVNSGIFATYDETDNSVIDLGASDPRGTSASIVYGDPEATVVVTQFFGDIQFDSESVGNEWNSGEFIAITLVDGDANLNSRTDEDLRVFNPDQIIPAIKVGSPITGSVIETVTGNFSTSLTPSKVVGPSLPLVPGNGHIRILASNDVSDIGDRNTANATAFSDIIRFSNSSDYVFNTKHVAGGTWLNFTLSTTTADLSAYADNGTVNSIYHVLQYDLRSIGNTLTNPEILDIVIYNLTAANNPRIISTELADVLIGSTQKMEADIRISEGGIRQGTNYFGFSPAYIGSGSGQVAVGFKINATQSGSTIDGSTTYPVVIDFNKFGTSGDGVSASDRSSNAVYRLELEETGDNTATFVGGAEFRMANQLNINQSSTYTGLDYGDDSVEIFALEDLTDEDSIRVSYLDVGADGVATQISDQQEAPSHSGVVSFDSDSYKIGDTVTVTLEDMDLNVDVNLIDIFTPIAAGNDVAYDAIGSASYGINSEGEPFGRLLDITFDDERWAAIAQETGSGAGETCAGQTDLSGSNGPVAAGFTLVETSATSGVFTGTFQIPSNYCSRSLSTNDIVTVTGKDIEVNYVDYRDASGEIIEVGDGAGVRANTGSISLDRTVYPVPFGDLSDQSDTDTDSSTSNTLSVFPIHATGISANVNTTAETIGNGDLTIHIRVNDPDHDESGTGEDDIDTAGPGLSRHGPVKITVSRGSEDVILATAGFTNSTANTGKITVGTTTVDDSVAGGYETRELGPINEIAPDAGIFEIDFTIKWTDGPASSQCPPNTDVLYESANNSTKYTSELARFDTASSTSTQYCIQQGDIITVEYNDATDASGNTNTVTDSATFDLRNGVLQSDKSVYIIGGDMILTLIEPDLDLDNDGAETWDLDLIEWDSDAATCTIGGQAAPTCTLANFDPEPSDFRETGDSTGIFQVVLEVPSVLNNDNLERGEEIVLEYQDWGPSGANYVGEEKEDINLTVFTSNFGATVELDQKVYSWTDKVYITIVAPDHNFDSGLIDTVGDSSSDPIKVSTRGFNIDTYKLVETGVDTGIFTGEVILVGFDHDADGNANTGASGNDVGSQPTTTSTTAGPTDGLLEADNDDGITVSFEYSEDETVVGSALIRWNIGEVQWLEASYPASGTGVVRVIDPDMNWNPEAVDNYSIDVWSDSDAGGIDLTVTETNEATGIFEGTVFFTTTDESSGHRLRVAEGDTVTGEYEDNTLPDPYTTNDELDVAATTLIGTVVPPLERAPAANLRTVDAFGNSLDSVSVDQQVQITADLANGQDREQAFAYLAQIQDSNGVTVSLAWITGSLSSGQSFSPALSWIPTASGEYTATAFVWESVENPTALSPPVSTTITVQ
jgi:hypothetical protein